MPDVGEVSRLLSNLLEGLDALYDRWDHAELWLAWQLDATSVALRGSTWERPMGDAARALEEIGRSGRALDDRNTAALAATDQLDEPWPRRNRP
jgi:hypothetical protein